MSETAGWRGFAHRRFLRCGPRNKDLRRMFDSLSNRLGDVFGKLRGRGALTEADVRAAMREVRIALLEADVALPVVRSFVDQITELAIGQNVLRSVTPGQQVVKIVSDALTEMLGSETAELELAVTDRKSTRLNSSH